MLLLESLEIRKSDWLDTDACVSPIRWLIFTFGICEKELAWFASYLTERQQYCYLNGQHSEKRLVTCGIPQGSCLRLLLFILYTNDFEESLTKFTPNMYADDTSITLGGKNAYQLLEDLRNELQNVIDWLRHNTFTKPLLWDQDWVGNPLCP